MWCVCWPKHVLVFFCYGDMAVVLLCVAVVIVSLYDAIRHPYKLLTSGGCFNVIMKILRMQRTGIMILTVKEPHELV